MRYRFCPHCGMRYVSSVGGKCPHCGGSLTESTEPEAPPSDAEPVAPEEPPREAPTLEPPPPAEPLEPAAETPVTEPELEAPPTALEDGQVRCPHCGEALYSGEQVCWSCGKRVETGEPVAEAVPEPAGPLPMEDRGWRDEIAPDYRPPPSQAAMTKAYWSLGLGLASVLTCGVFGFLGPFALWLGIRATREGAGPVAVVGLLFGAIGTLLLLGICIAVGLLLVGELGPDFAFGIGGVIRAQLPL